MLEFKIMEELNLKSLFFEQVARIGKALSNAKRLEILDLLGQAEKSVDIISKQVGISIKLASSHLQDLKDAGLISSRKEGKFVYYKISDYSVLYFYIQLKNLAENKLIDNKNVLSNFLNSPDDISKIDKKELLKKAKKGEVIIIDVRPEDEYKSGHIPYARSIPINELEKEIKSLSKEKEIIAYCRGATCVWSHKAVEELKEKGFKASRMREGFAEWSFSSNIS